MNHAKAVRQGGFFVCPEFKEFRMRQLIATLAVAIFAIVSAPVLANPVANLKSAEAFLAANAKKPKVITTKTGLQYMVLKAGKGRKPAASNTVRVHYRGYFKNGRVFDQSIGGDPIEFPLSGVIAGWTEGVSYMPVGSKYRFWIHPRLAYGPEDKGPIPGNSMLIFDVELLGITG
jgi:FKBP-type peptidyl-prolyl cis-trans isomerase FkpA